MKTQILVIRDIKLDCFGQPQACASIGVGARAFSDAINNPERNTDMSKHPEDFELWHIGEYDDATATIVPISPQFITKGSNNVQ